MSGRDIRPALGTRGGPAPWERAQPGAQVAQAAEDFGDARWSYLYKAADTEYAAETEPGPDEVAAASRRMREAAVDEVHGPLIKGPVWTWEVPAYFWVGGTASGCAFVALACDAAGDRRSASIARRVALGVVLPAPALLIADLGRPERFLNMLRIFKPRSPMNLGAWCLVMFSASATAAVGADLVGRARAARALGAGTALLGGYLGSYTGVLLASTAVPVWSRSRAFLGPIFVATATATGAAATRLVLVARGLPAGHPTRVALRAVQTSAIVTELGLSAVNERRLGELARPLRRGRSGMMFRAAQASVGAGLAAEVLARRDRPRLEDLASVLFMTGGLAFRFGWVEAGRASAADDAAVAAAGRGAREPRLESRHRRALPGIPGRRAWGELVRRTSLAVERALHA